LNTAKKTNTVVSIQVDTISSTFSLIINII